MIVLDVSPLRDELPRLIERLISSHIRPPSYVPPDDDDGVVDEATAGAAFERLDHDRR